MGTFPDSMSIRRVRPIEILGDSFTYSIPGTYVAVVRITSNANGDSNALYVSSKISPACGWLFTRKRSAYCAAG